MRLTPRLSFVVIAAVALLTWPAPAWAHHRDWASESGLPWWNVLVGVGIALLVVVEAVLIYSRRRAPHASSDGPLERIWTLAPLVLLTVLGGVLLTRPLLLPSASITRLAANVVGADALIVQVRARQFDWTFHYAAERVVAHTEVHVPVGRPVLLRMQSDDVLHSFDVPRLQLRADVPYGAVMPLAFRATRPDRYVIVCTALCGTGVQEMQATLVVDEPAAFSAWVREQATRTAARR